MKHCLSLAISAKAKGKTAVGSILVKEDQIIAEGIEGADDLPDNLAHAEVLAVTKALNRLATKDLSNCILYTTVEPCFMCSYLIRQTGIKEVVFGTTTPETGGVSSDFPILTTANIDKWNPPPTVIEGVLKSECEDILK